ncbi:MAG: flagellar motor switch protein FliG [Gammaproteobacteria bacterium]|nr:flagellar motor switch protein FliG [Gammaproteobacteria bacterium]
MPEADKADVRGIDKAAILLMSLGEEEASEILRHMGPKEVQSVGTAMSGVANVGRDKVESVLDAFLNLLTNQTSLGIGSNDYIRSVLVKALGEEKASGVIDRILLGGNSQGLESLKWMDPKAVAEIIRLEHPQIVAIVLSYLEPDQAALVLAALPARTRSDIVMRIATMEGIQPSAIRELDQIMENHFSSDSNIKSASVGGTKTAAEILNFIDSSLESEIMDSVRESDNDLGDEISELMFVFDDLIDVDDRGIQTLLRDISTDTLVLALKGADGKLKQKILKNMSQRAAQMLSEDMDAKGPVKVSDVEAAQKEILAVARQKEADSEISLGGGSGEAMI